MPMECNSWLHGCILLDVWDDLCLIYCTRNPRGLGYVLHSQVGVDATVKRGAFRSSVTDGLIQLPSQESLRGVLKIL